MVRVIEAAPAKLNLALHVTGRRDDGYHLLDSLVGFAAVGDVIGLDHGALSLHVDGPFAAALSGGDNLCLRAARLAGAEVAIHLTKNLPIASGIGGGSADAAAVLRGLSRLKHTLPDRTERLGADVPVCLSSQPARMQGVGEVVTPLPPFPEAPLVLVNPGVGVSTPQVFAALARKDNSGLPDIPHFRTLDDLLSWLALTRNDLEGPAGGIAPAIAQVLQALRFSGAAFSRMSGSGATCFGMFDTQARAHAAAVKLQQHGWWAVPTKLAPLARPG